MARYAQALRVIAAYDTCSALVVCDELGVLADHIERMLPLP